MSNAQGSSATYRLDTIYDLLDARRRRLVLHCLRSNSDDVVQYEALKDQVLIWERRYEDVARSDDHEERVTSELHHVHIPKLADCGVIDYDWRSGTIRYYPGAVLEAHLDLAAERDLK